MEFIPEIARTAWTQYINSRSLKDNLDLLRTEMQELGSRQTDVIISLNTAKVVDGKKPKAEVSLWLENVETITSQMTKIEEDCKEVGRDFLHSRVALGNLVIKKIEEVMKLKEKGRFSEGLLADILPEMEFMPTTKLVGRATAERNFEQIWDSLINHKARIIGVYGMGGVGKTTIMTHIYNRIQSSRIYGIAIWVTVSNDFTIERLQSSIAQAISLDLSNEHDEMRRTMKLSEALKRREKLIVIFDDVWKSFPLEMVGITKDNACKIVLTTRSKNVCRGMNCQKMFEVEVLLKEEAWELFKERLGVNAVLSSEVEQIAKLVTKECAGLPLGIITVASAMREKNNIREWRNALAELQCSTMDIEGMDDKVFQILKFSFDRLKSESVRSCFLYCALFPEDYQIGNEDLIGCWMAEGLIDDMGDWEMKVDKGHTILNGLIDVCMLVRRSDNHVAMHDLIRDLAIGITRKSPRFVVKAGIGIRGSIGVEEFTEDVEKFSLMQNKIEMLSGEPNCPKLSTLLLQENPLSRNISHKFFNRMNSLRVLDLSNTGIEYMPESVSNLDNLCILLLNNCRRLRQVPSLAKLKCLRLLDLSYTSIKELPHGMECLVNLKELYVHSKEWVDFDRYVRSGHWKCLKSFHLSSESCSLTLEKYRMDFVNCNFIGEESSFMLPHNIEVLDMYGCQLSSLPCLSRLQRLQECGIFSCSVEWLLPIGDNTAIIGDNTAIMSLPSIQFLCLRELPSFRGLCKGVLPPDSFACLRRLTVHECHVLENLMSVQLFQHLQFLEQIDIAECSEMEEVIQGGEAAMVEKGDNNNTNNTILLPNLRELNLINVGKLKSICKWVIICPSLIEISIVGCCQLKKIPLSLGHSKFPVGGAIKGCKEWWDALEWDDPSTKTLLQLLFKEEDEGGQREGCGMKRKGEQELEEVASTSQRQESPKTENFTTSPAHHNHRQHGPNTCLHSNTSKMQRSTKLNPTNTTTKAWDRPGERLTGSRAVGTNTHDRS